MRNKEIKKQINYICRNDECSERLGYAIKKSMEEENIGRIGGDLINLTLTHPDELELIENVVIAICGYGFDSLREKIKSEKKEYEHRFDY